MTNPLLKPKFGSPCNGCGLCCQMEVCKLGKMALGADAKEPCELLIHDGARFHCKLVVIEDAMRRNEPDTEPMIRNALAIEKGCDADD